jgi:hypothetical protein
LASIVVNTEPAKIEVRLQGLSSSVQETVAADLENQLSDLKSKIGRIPSPTPPPRTTLQIQDDAATERAWQNYLAYFLDPTADHGLQADALNQFLGGLSNHVDRNLPERIPDHVSEDVDVFTERESDAGNQPDLVIWETGWFFICCELKLYSSEKESQTRRYARDDQVGQKLKEDVPERGHHYAYIRRPGTDDADADQFANVTWKQVKRWLTPLVTEGRGRYPSRTTAQLSDFLDTIHLDMTDDFHLETEKEKMDLYFEHLDAIEQAKDGLETVYEHAKDNWRRYFIDGYLPDTWTEEWHCDPQEYGQFYHSKWRQEDRLKLLDGKVEMHFVHLIRKKESFEDGKLTVELRWSGGRNRYKKRFKELFQSDRFADKIDPILGEHKIVKAPNDTKKNPRLTRKIYEVDRRNLPNSYFETLSTAVKEHQELGPVINEVLKTAIGEVNKEIKTSSSRG